MRLLTITAAVVMSTLVVKPTFGSVLQIYTFTFTTLGSTYPSFSFTEAFPDFVTMDGSLSISPVALPDAMNVTQALTCAPNGASGEIFEFFSTNAMPGFSCPSVTFAGPASTLWFVLYFSAGYPATDGVFTASATSLSGNGLGNPNNPAWSDSGIAS